MDDPVATPFPGLRVALVDDHAVVRTGYRRLLELEHDIEVVAEYGEAETAYAQLVGAAGRAVQLLVLDLFLPGRSGLDLMRQLGKSRPELRALIFTMHDGVAMVDQCLKAGAAGFITKSSAPETLVDAVRRAARGETVLSADVADMLRQHEVRGAPHHQLSGREFAVLEQLLVGKDVDAIAAHLGVSTKTVWNHQSNIRHKLNVAGAMELLQYATRYGLLMRQSGSAGS